MQAADCYGRRARTARLYLGHRRTRGAGAECSAAPGRLTRPANYGTDTVQSASRQRLWWHAVKENPREVLCGSLPARPALLVARQLPTDHDHDGERSRSIPEYQSDQPSHIAATAAVHLRLNAQEP